MSVALTKVLEVCLTSIIGCKDYKMSTELPSRTTAWIITWTTCSSNDPHINTPTLIMRQSADPTVSSHSCLLPFEIISSILSQSAAESKAQLLALLSLSSSYYPLLLPQLYSQVILDRRERLESFLETIRESKELGIFVQSLVIGTDETLEKSPLEGDDRSLVTSKIRAILSICSQSEIDDDDEVRCDVRGGDRDGTGTGSIKRSQVESVKDETGSLLASQRMKRLRISSIRNLAKVKRNLDHLALEQSLLFCLPPFGNQAPGLIPLTKLNPKTLTTSGSNPRPQLDWFLRSSSIAIEALPFEGSNLRPSCSSTSSNITKRIKEIKLVNVLSAPNRILKGSETLSGQLIRASYSEAYTDADGNEGSLSDLHLPQQHQQQQAQTEPQMPRPGPVIQQVKLQSLVKDVLVLLTSSGNLMKARRRSLQDQEGRGNDSGDENGNQREESEIKIVLQGPRGYGLEDLEDRLRLQVCKGKVEERDLKRVEIRFV